MKMQLKCWLFILLFLIVCLLNGGISKTCVDKNRNDKMNCCDNHENVNGTCVACKIGYISDFGERCRKCPYGLYGSKCLEKCKCKIIESCHHIDGCKEIQTTVVAKIEFVTAKYKLHRGTEGTSSSFTSTTSFDGTSLTGLSTREKALYSVSIGGFTSLGLVLLCRYILNKHRNRSVPLEGENERNNVTMHVITVGNIEGIYETIDESSMIDDNSQVTVPITVEDTSSEESSDSEHSHSLLTNEYLNPYQPTVADPEKHEYNIATEICSDDSGSSGSSGTNNGYLNPYQQIIPDPESHNYLSIQAEIHCLGSSASDENEKDYKCRKEKEFEQMGDIEETNNDNKIELQNPHSQQCLEENISHSEKELQKESYSITVEIPVDMRDSFSAEVSVDDVPFGYASSALEQCELEQFKTQ